MATSEGQALVSLPGTWLVTAGEPRSTRDQNQRTHLKPPLKVLKLKHPHLKALCKSAP